MPTTFYDLPPDHPIFSGGPHFVFRNEEPLHLTPADEDEESEDE